MKYAFLWIGFLLSQCLLAQTEKTLIKGWVNDQNTGEPLVGVSVYVPNKSVGTASNAAGEFTLSHALPCTIELSYVGYEKQSILITTAAQLPLKLSLKEKGTELRHATVVAKKENELKHTAGLITLQPLETRFLAAAGGERDALQALSLMPGVKKSASGGEGYFVRGGSPDQNLISVDEAPLYNPNHLLGFFSAFNPESVSDVKLYKGAFPAMYGGRLSGIMNVTLKEAPSDKWRAEVGVSLLSARVNVGGPLFHPKLTVQMGFRKSYIEEAYQLVGNTLPYRFADFNLKMAYQVNDKTHITYTQFYGNDVLDYAPGTKNNNEVDFGTKVKNSAYVVHLRQQKAQGVLNVYALSTQFTYQVKAGLNQNIFGLRSDIRDLQVKGNYTQLLSKKSSVKVGFESTRHQFSPNQTSIFGSINELLQQFKSRSYGSFEAAIYAEHSLQYNAKWNMVSGLRLSSSFGNHFAYAAPEPRILVSYQISAQQSIKFSYNRMVQYMHLVSGSSAVMPTDLWFPVSKQVKPQSAHQFALSFDWQLPHIKSMMSIEPYVKTMQNLVEYKEGTQILLNNNIEQDLIQGMGRAYGIEWMLQKKTGKFFGWISYNLSWTERKFEALNAGNWFYARYDRRHDWSLVANYKLKHNLILSSTFVLSSGTRMTPIIGKYAIPSGSLNEIISVPIYGARNSMVLAPLHRLDLNLTYVAGKWKNMDIEWSVGAFNIYNRTQPFKLSMISNGNGQMEFKQVGLYGFIPSLSLNAKF